MRNTSHWLMDLGSWSHLVVLFGKLWDVELGQRKYVTGVGL